MELAIHNLTLAALVFPLLGAIIAGIFGKKIGRRGAHWVTVLSVAIAFVCALALFFIIVVGGAPAYNGVIYTWGISGSFHFDVGILVDHLTASMMVIVTFVSLLVHIYSIGYMREDPGYQRFFSYMAFFTFFMLTLTAANNFALLFFGWEGVGLVSYLLIGFWFKKESAAQGSLKAFLVNRAGDFGFILGIAAILDYFGTVDYAGVFSQAPTLATTTLSLFPGTHVHLMTVICILLFIGAMGKSAQVPLHVWLPESMEGPTPISALIHAATMVTAGVYVVARLSPLFELSQVALSMVLVIGATTALFLGIVGVVQNDIKRVIAYSTISQLGYMMAANGASAFSAGIFHLFTHACFKALLFLSAGSVIIAMQHEQDLRKMGGLVKYMPITYVAFLIGGLALSAVPPFAGFYSKDAIIAAVGRSTIPGASYAYWCLVLGAFVTALYTFRAFFLAFHAKERMDENTRSQLKESPLVVTIPLICLAIPSVFLGMMLAGPMLYHQPGMLGSSIHVVAKYNVLGQMASAYQGAWHEFITAFMHLPFWFSIGGIAVAWLFYVKYPSWANVVVLRFSLIHNMLVHKYGFDAFNDWVFVRGVRRLCNFCFYVADLKVIDDMLVNGSGRMVTRLSGWIRVIQTGYLYHYVLALTLGLFFGLLLWLIW